MQTRQHSGYYALLGLSAALSAAAIVTLIPSAAASKPNVLGYRSVCSFAPAATALCGLAAGIVCTIRNRLVSSRSAATRYQPPILPVAVGLLLVTIAAVFGIRFGLAQSRFGRIIESSRPSASALGALADGAREATFSDGEVSATVRVTVRAGRIEDLALAAGANVPVPVALTIFEAVRGHQSTAVDAVSGATASSNVLLRAIEAAAAASP